MFSTLRSCPHRLLRWDKHAWFTLFTFFIFISCTILCILALVFVPTAPVYSICNQNIQWGSIFKSITTLGYPSANVTFHTSIYNPNRFTIDLHRLQLTLFYKGEYFGNAAISYNQTQLMDNHFDNLEPELDTDLAHTPPHLLHSTHLPSLSTEQRIEEELNPPTNLSNNSSKHLTTARDDDLTPLNSSHPSNHPPTTFSSHPHRESVPNPALSSSPTTFNHLHESVAPRPIIELTAGNITDIYVDAIIEPTFNQAIEMAKDYSNSRLFIAVRVSYDTSVFAWYTPRINYNATTDFREVDIGATKPTKFNHNNNDIQPEWKHDLSFLQNSFREQNPRMTLFGIEMPSFLSSLLHKTIPMTHSFDQTFEQDDLIHVHAEEGREDSQASKSNQSMANQSPNQLLSQTRSKMTIVTTNSVNENSKLKHSGSGEGIKNYCKCGGDFPTD